MGESTATFLSYSSRDRGVVERVATGLRARGIDVWYDEWELSAGDSLVAQIEKGIRRAAFVVIFQSANALKSPWVRQEYEASKIRQIESADGRLTLVPARLDDSPLPPLLSPLVWADFRQSFIQGFTRVSQAILGDTELGHIDRVFSRITATPEYQDAVACTFDIQELQLIRDNRLKSVYYSAQALKEHADSPYASASRIEKWLGATTRDYAQFRLYDTAIKELKGGIGLVPDVSYKSIIDKLFWAYTDLLEKFGRGRGPEDRAWVARDLERIHTALLNKIASGESADPRPQGTEPSPVIDLDDASLLLNPAHCTVSRGGTSSSLTPTEFGILGYLVRHHEVAVTPTKILESVQNHTYPEPDAAEIVRVYIRRIRRKVEADPDRPRFIEEVRGTGYRSVGQILVAHSDEATSDG